MLATALEFAPGTTPHCKRPVTRLLQEPGAVLGAYRAARQQFRTGDIVLETAEYDPSGFKAMPRARYVDTKRSDPNGAKIINALTIAHQSAHKVASLPWEADAFWLVINLRDDMPVMIALFAAPYATGRDAREPMILS